MAEFVRALSVSRFSRAAWLFAAMLLSLGAARLAFAVGPAAAIGVVAAATLLLIVGPIVLEREHWRAQDVFIWYQALRAAEWIAQTGAPPPPPGDPAANEVWLGAHQPGSVPQLYRVFAAIGTRDPLVIDREAAALEATTPLERVQRLWALSGLWSDANEQHVRELAAAVAELPAGEDRAPVDAYLACVEALHRQQSRDPAWRAPLVALWPTIPRPPLGARRRLRIVIARFGLAIWFPIMTGLLAWSLAPLLAPAIPRDYANTSISTRGDVPASIDFDAVWMALPGVAQALPDGRRNSGRLDELEWSALVDGGMPTLIWDVGAINLAAPADAPDRHVAGLELLLGSSDPKHGRVIVTFDTTDGPSYLYDISPTAVRAVQQALGVAAAP